MRAYIEHESVIAGLYGVISYSVAQRRQGISIRIAMGAAASEVSRQVLRQGMTLVGFGVILGIGVSVVAAAAIYLPARRAASVDPMRAFRGD